MSRGLLIDTTKCIDCGTCTMACKDEYYDNTYLPYTLPQPELGQFWIKVNLVVRGTYPKVKARGVALPCQHCDDAPCIKAATGGAVYKRPDGIVLIDPFKSVGQKQIVSSCPYGVVYWNDKLNIPQKCTLCAHRIDAGEQPKCVQSCPTNAIQFGEYEALKGTTGAEVLHPEYNAKPKVVYIGLPHTLIAGAVIDSSGECVSGADVTATDTAANQVAASAKTNAFGDFWLDGLTASKTYQVAINAAGRTKSVSVTLDTDKNLGDIQV